MCNMKAVCNVQSTVVMCSVQAVCSVQCISSVQCAVYNQCAVCSVQCAMLVEDVSAGEGWMEEQDPSVHQKLPNTEQGKYCHPSTL